MIFDDYPGDNKIYESYSINRFIIIIKYNYSLKYINILIKYSINIRHYIYIMKYILISLIALCVTAQVNVNLLEGTNSLNVTL